MSGSSKGSANNQLVLRGILALVAAVILLSLFRCDFFVSVSPEPSGAGDDAHALSTISSSSGSDEPYFDFDETDTDGVTEDDFTELDNGDMLYEGSDSTGYMDSDGYSYYKNSDGSLEVTDGYGNAVKDYDGDGVVDAMTTDGGGTWVDVN